MSRKGFIRVVELIIFVSLLFGFLIPNFRSVGTEESSNVYLSPLCYSILYSLDKSKKIEGFFGEYFYKGSNPNWQNSSELKEILEKMAGHLREYEIGIDGIAKNKLKIACLNCSVEQKKFLRRYIGTPSFPINEFGIFNYQIADVRNWSDSDVIILIEKNLSKYRDKISSFLSKGKGLVILNNFTSLDSYSETLLNITDHNSITFGSKFWFKEEGIGYSIGKRFIHTWIRVYKGKFYLHGNRYSLDVINTSWINISECNPSLLKQEDTCTTSDNFSVILVNKVDPLTIGEHPNWADLSFKKNSSDFLKYEFIANLMAKVKSPDCIVKDGNDYCLAIARTLENNSKVFWMPNILEKDKVDLLSLFKAGLIWSSERKYFVFDKKIPENYISCSYLTRIEGFPIAIYLYLWSLV